MIKDALKSDFLDVDAFGELSTEEKAAVEELQAELGDIATKIDSGLTVEDTAELVDKINQLSSESQEIFFNQLQSSVSDPSTLEALYADMFK